MSYISSKSEETDLVVAFVHCSEGAFANLLAYNIWLYFVVFWTASLVRLGKWRLPWCWRRRRCHGLYRRTSRYSKGDKGEEEE